MAESYKNLTTEERLQLEALQAKAQGESPESKTVEVRAAASKPSIESEGSLIEPIKKVGNVVPIRPEVQVNSKETSHHQRQLEDLLNTGKVTLEEINVNSENAADIMQARIDLEDKAA